MPDQPTELRCPKCAKLLAVASPDFAGAISTKCGRCRNDIGYPIAEAVATDRLTCTCGKWLACGHIERGYVQLICHRDRALARLSPSGATLVEESRRPHKEKPPREKREARPPAVVMLPVQARPLPVDTLVTLVEDRWLAFQQRRAYRRVDVAVGIRFDVLSRDGFRCRYCGHGVDQGVLLEVDHIIPRAAGGLDVMSNLRTACQDCNRGKSAKLLTIS